MACWVDVAEATLDLLGVWACQRTQDATYMVLHWHIWMVPGPLYLRAMLPSIVLEQFVCDRRDASMRDNLPMA